MSYKHLTLSERGKLEGFLTLKKGIREIALLMGRHPSTIIREIRRNSFNESYQADKAQTISSQRVVSASTRTKLSQELLEIIEDKLTKTWSPEQISNTVLKGLVSFKSIYRWIYEGKINSNNLGLLRHKGRKRKGVEKRGIFVHGVSISERPEQANNRSEFGHWELDSMVSSRGESKGVFSTFIERKSRLYTAFVGKDRTANTMELAIRRLYEALPKGALKSVTSDRGKEFACHTTIKDTLKIDFFFANAYAPWQRGSNENGNGLLREFYPKQTDLAKVTQQELRQKLELINNRPRKCLNWKTPVEVFLHEVLHLA
nr:unnamed protein product [uncultured bacterium]